MKKKTCKIFTLLFFLSVCCLSYAQPNYPEINKTCGDVTTTLAYLPSIGVVKALVIYFKFQDDEFDLYPYTNDWDEDALGNDALPSWAYDILSPYVQSQYQNPSLSGYFHEMSLGNFELIGDEYPNNGTPYISLNDVSWYYTSHNPPGNCEGIRHLSYAVYEALTRLDNQINYSDYDANHDGYVDLIIMWFRFHQAACTSTGGFSGVANLHANNPNSYFIPGVIEITTAEGTKIRGSSGVIVESTSSRYVNIVAHEIGHLMGFAHDAWQGYYSLMTYEGMGLTNSFERRYLNWIDDYKLETMTTTQLNYGLTDFETTGKAIKIPINVNDFYLLEYRQRDEAGFYSSENWTKWPAGHGYEEGPPMIPDEGLVINKWEPGGSNMIISQIQCADHRWVFDREFNIFKFPFIKLYPSTQGFDNNCFEMDIFAESAISNCINRAGTKCLNVYDREYHPDVWGDNKDLWDIGYNQVFSTWSNPKSVLNNLAIEIKSKNLETKTMYLDIRFENPENTSPSKPLFLRVTKDYMWPDSSPFHPNLTWYRNLEPDVDNGVGKYRIYRGIVTHINVDPPYSLIAEVPSSQQTYSDNEITLYDPIPDNPICPFVKKSYVYRVSAVDYPQNLESVRSDSVYIEGYEDPCAREGDNFLPVQNGVIPKDFSFYNYPNPFNPVTEIRYSLPHSTYVTIKIYNILGEEISNLSNYVFHNAGVYKIRFSGINLASGLYFYRIELRQAGSSTGSYTETKKMLLIK